MKKITKAAIGKWTFPPPEGLQNPPISLEKKSNPFKTQSHKLDIPAKLTKTAKSPINQSKPFKPLIAGSLAIAMGVSVAVASPTIEGILNGSRFGISHMMPSLTWKLRDSLFQSNAQNITFVFIRSDAVQESLDNGNFTAKIGVGGLIYNEGGFPEIFIGGSFGLQIGDGKGTLKIDMGDNHAAFEGGFGIHTERDFYLDFSQVRGIALNGKLELITGATTNDGRARGNFRAIFGGNVVGDIKVLSMDDRNHQEINAATFVFNKDAHLVGDFISEGVASNILVFQDNASLKGHIFLRSGVNSFRFDNGSIEGNIYKNFIDISRKLVRIDVRFAGNGYIGGGVFLGNHGDRADLIEFERNGEIRGMLSLDRTSPLYLTAGETLRLKSMRVNNSFAHIGTNSNPIKTLVMSEGIELESSPEVNIYLRGSSMSPSKIGRNENRDQAICINESNLNIDFANTTLELDGGIRSFGGGDTNVNFFGRDSHLKIARGDVETNLTGNGANARLNINVQGLTLSDGKLVSGTNGIQNITTHKLEIINGGIKANGSFNAENPEFGKGVHNISLTLGSPNGGETTSTIGTFAKDNLQTSIEIDDSLVKIGLRDNTTLQIQGAMSVNGSGARFQIESLANEGRGVILNVLGPTILGKGSQSAINLKGMNAQDIRVDSSSLGIKVGQLNARDIVINDVMGNHSANIRLNEAKENTFRNLSFIKSYSDIQGEGVILNIEEAIALRDSTATINVEKLKARDMKINASFLTMNAGQLSANDIFLHNGINNLRIVLNKMGRSTINNFISDGGTSNIQGDRTILDIKGDITLGTRSQSTINVEKLKTRDIKINTSSLKIYVGQLDVNNLVLNDAGSEQSVDIALYKTGENTLNNLSLNGGDLSISGVSASLKIHKHFISRNRAETNVILDSLRIGGSMIIDGSQNSIIARSFKIGGGIASALHNAINQIEVTSSDRVEVGAFPMNGLEDFSFVNYGGILSLRSGFDVDLRGGINTEVMGKVIATTQLVAGGHLSLNGDISIRANSMSSNTLIFNSLSLPSDAVIKSRAGVNNIILKNDQSIINEKIIPDLKIFNQGGETHLIFASFSQDKAKSVDSDPLNNTFAGQVFKDGVKLKILDTGEKIAKVQMSRADNVDTLKLEGNVIGSLSSLNSSVVTQFNITQLQISESSKFYGNIESKLTHLHLGPSALFVGKIQTDSKNHAGVMEHIRDAKLTLDDKAKVFIKGEKTSLQTLELNAKTSINPPQFILAPLEQEGTIIDLATNGEPEPSLKNRNNFRLLEIGKRGIGAMGSMIETRGMTGNGSLIFVTSANLNANQAQSSLGGMTAASKMGYVYADRIVIEKADGPNASDKYYMQVIFDKSMKDLSVVKYANGTGTETEGNIAVATIKREKGRGVIALEHASEYVQGFDVIGTRFQSIQTDEHGRVDANGDYETYFVSGAASRGADDSIYKTLSTIAVSDKELYLANFNSLNKRMGELRDNTHSQGAWARIFHGKQSNDFGLGSQTFYTTLQGGYDYAFGFEGANNFLGLAISYSVSDATSNKIINQLNDTQEGMDKLKSNLFEVALYNAYVEDEGWYNDTIAKISFMMNTLSVSGTGRGRMVEINNAALTLSDEFGYRFKFGESKEWYIDPQFELGVGYVMGNQFTQIDGGSFLMTEVDSMVILKSRFGASFGYDFKNLSNSEDGSRVKLYLGIFGELDCFGGGMTTSMTSRGVRKSINHLLDFDGRMVINYGTNFEVKDNARFYVDMEHSFIGKIQTAYKANFGMRYSFGDNANYKPASAVSANGESKAPLKLESKEEQAGGEK